MPPRGGRPRHSLSAYITVLNKTSPEDKDRQCVCIACAEVLKDEAKPMINKKDRIKKHLISCGHFWNKYDNAAEILRDCEGEEETHSAKYIRTDGEYFFFFINFVKRKLLKLILTSLQMIMCLFQVFVQILHIHQLQVVILLDQAFLLEKFNKLQYLNMLYVISIRLKYPHSMIF
jgi:hypothetical protein